MSIEKVGAGGKPHEDVSKVTKTVIARAKPEAIH
jgi:hypothetical protein